MMGIYPSQLGRVRWREVNRRAREIASTVHLEADLRRKCATLSPAEQRLVMIARALARNASLVIMDEPTVSLSEVEVEALKNVVRELRVNNVTVIYVSHRLDEVLELTDRVTVMKDGRVIVHRRHRGRDQAPADRADHRAHLRGAVPGTARARLRRPGAQRSQHLGWIRS